MCAEHGTARLFTVLGRAEHTAAKHLGCAGDSTEPAVLSSRASICLRILTSADVAEACMNACQGLAHNANTVTDLLILEFTDYTEQNSAPLCQALKREKALVIEVTRQVPCQITCHKVLLCKAACLRLSLPCVT